MRKKRTARSARVSRRSRSSAAPRVRRATSSRLSELRLWHVAELANDVIYRTRLVPAYRIEYISPSIEALTGYAPEEFYADADLTRRLVHPDDQHELQRQLAQPPVDGTQMVIRWRRRDGAIVWTQSRNIPIFDSRGRLIAVEGIARDVTSWKQAEESLLASQRDLQMKSDALASVNAIADTVYRSLDFGTVVARAVDAIVAFTHAPGVALYTLDDDGQHLQLLAGSGLGEDGRRVGSILPVDGSLSGLVVAQKEIITSDDLACDARAEPTVRAFLRRKGVGAMVIVPLLFHDRVLGVMNLMYDRYQPLDVLERETLLSIGKTIGLAMANAQHVTRMKAEEATRLQAEEVLRARTEELQNEALIAAALAHFGHEMLAALDSPRLLERMCELTAEVLQCDSSHTLLWQPEEDVFVPVAGSGATAEEEEVARVLKIPRIIMRVLIDRLEHDEVAQVGTIPEHVLSAERQQELGVSVQLCMAVRRGRDIIGIQNATSRHRTAPFSPQQWRIARGIAQLASLFLAHARVVGELERASRLKSEFVATMSHELRTPLNVIMGYTDLLLDGMFGTLSRDQTHTMRQIEKNAQALLELINATLDLSRLDSGHVPLDLGEVSIAALVEQLAAETQEVRSKPNVTFEWDVAAQLPRLHSDPLKLKVILKNLIGNAMKFTPAGQVTVAVQALNGGVEFRVSDTGIGMSREIQAFVFEPFRQGDGSNTRRFGGVGLGLYIVRRLAEILGGTVSVDSDVGCGSTFRVWMPPEATRAHSV